MKKFTTKILSCMNGVSFGSIVLLLVFWLVAQVAVSALTLRLFWFDEKVATQAWSLLDKVSPAGYFLSSLSLPYAFLWSGTNSLFVTILNGLVQYFLWVPFSWLLLEKIATKQQTPSKFFSHLRMSLILLPIFIASSLAGLLLHIAIANSVISDVWKSIFVGVIPDFVSLVLFFTFVPALYFNYDGYGIRQSLKHSILAFRKWFLIVCLSILFVLVPLSLISQLLIDTHLISAGMYGPVRMTLQVTGWIASAGIWFLTGFAYHDYKACLLEPFVRKPEGVGYEQILETPAS
jgi:hypothetical protein